MLTSSHYVSLSLSPSLSLSLTLSPQPLRQAQMDAILQYTEDYGFLSQAGSKFNVSVGDSGREFLTFVNV